MPNRNRESKMNFWFIALMIFVLALVIGPLAMLKPKPAQRQKEQLRLKARELGLHFAMMRLPQLKTAQEKPDVCPVYFLPPSAALAEAKGWILLRTAYEHESNFYQEWDWHESHKPSENVMCILRSHMAKLPLSIKAISAGSLGVCVFWQEQGGEDCLYMIQQILQELVAATSIQ